MENNNSNNIDIKIIKKKKVYKNDDDIQKRVYEIIDIESKQKEVNSLTLCNIDGLENYFENINSFPKY